MQLRSNLIGRLSQPRWWVVGDEFLGEDPGAEVGSGLGEDIGVGEFG